MGQSLLRNTRFFRSLKNVFLLKNPGFIYLHYAKKLPNMTKKTRQRPKLSKPTRKQTEYDAKLNLLTDYIFNNLSKGKNEKYTKREYSYKDDLFNTEETSTVKKPETPLIDKKVDGRNYIATDPETKTTKQMSGNIMPPLIGSGPQILNVTKAYILKLTNYAIIQGMLEKAKWNYKPK